MKHLLSQCFLLLAIMATFSYTSRLPHKTLASQGNPKIGLVIESDDEDMLYMNDGFGSGDGEYPEPLDNDDTHLLSPVETPVVIVKSSNKEVDHHPHQSHVNHKHKPKHKPIKEDGLGIENLLPSKPKPNHGGNRKSKTKHKPNKHLSTLHDEHDYDPEEYDDDDDDENDTDDGDFIFDLVNSNESPSDFPETKERKVVSKIAVVVIAVFSTACGVMMFVALAAFLLYIYKYSKD